MLCLKCKSPGVGDTTLSSHQHVITFLSQDIFPFSASDSYKFIAAPYNTTCANSPSLICTKLKLQP